MKLEEFNKIVQCYYSNSCATISDEYDSMGNHHITRVYEIDGKFFAVGFTNDYPNREYIRGKGYTDNVMMTEVEKKEVTVIKFVPKE